jgi:hypothetical protein
LDEEGDDAFHAFEVVVVAAVDVAEAEDEGFEAVAAGVAGEEGLAGDFTGGVGAFGDDEIGHGFVGDMAEDVAVDLAAGAEDDAGALAEVACGFQGPESHGDIFEGLVGLADELVDLGPGGEVDDDVGLEGFDGIGEGEGGAVGRGGEGRRWGPGHVETFGGEAVGPGVGAFIDAQDVVAAVEEGEGEVGADLPGGTGD